MSKISYLEQIEYKQKVNSIYLKNLKNEFEINVEIKKNQNDDKFTIIVKNIPFKYKNIVVSLNNKINYVGDKIFSSVGSSITISSKNLGDTLFSNVTSIAVALNAVNTLNSMLDKFPNYNNLYISKMWKRISELSIKIKKPEINNKFFFINEKGLEIETCNSFKFSQRANSLIVRNDKSIIKVIPKKIIVGKHNVEIFDVKNISKTPIPPIVPKIIEGLEIDNSGKTNKVIYKKSFNSLELLNGIVGKINFSGNTYYDLKKQKTYPGIGINSRNGYIIPYNFKGDLVPIINLDVGPIKNIFIGFSNPIKNAYLNKYSGLIKLNIVISNQPYNDDYENQTIIQNSYFSNIISENLTLEDIRNLGKNDQ